MDTRILERLGLTQGEIKAYLALLKLGSSSTGPIAKHSGVSRSKLYIILDKLEKKGFVSHVDKQGVTYFQAVEPSKINDYLDEKQEELELLKKDFENFLPKLQNFHKFSGELQQVNVYQGLKGMKVAHEHLYLKVKRGEEYYYLGIPAEQPEPHHRYWKKDHLRRIEEGIKCKLLFNRDTDGNILKNRNTFKGCDARWMPTDIKTPSEILIYKDTTTINVVSENPIAIEIISQEIADSFKAYFLEFWKRSKPFRKK